MGSSKDYQSLKSMIMARDWFYQYQLPCGEKVPLSVSPETTIIHDTRWSMAQLELDRTFGNQLSASTAIDLSCHQGFFSFELAKCCNSVTGVDINSQNIEDAKLMQTALGAEKINFVNSSIFELGNTDVKPADITLMFGLLYNLENPIGGLRIAKQLTKKVLLVETQTTALDLTGRVDSGSYQWGNEMMGIFGIFPGLPGLTIGSETDIILYPSPKGLVWILKRLGFSSVEILTPPQGAYEQIASGKRVVVAAHV